jgi:F-type H+-transporting ATPase subunit delta
MSVVSDRYARALFDALSSDGVIDSGQEQIEAIGAVLADYPDARQLLVNPVFPPERREEFLARLGDVLGLDGRVRRLLALLVERRRLSLFPEIVQAFRRRVDQKNGIVRASVTTAAPLGEAERQQVNARLEQALGKRVIMTDTLDPSLLGGVVVQVGSTVYDGSLRQYLAGAKSRLLAG